ncbi:MAG: nucleotidyltransferase [Muribaculaceae bacterium]
MKPTLYVLAAGMGSRYGGLKQLDGLGPNGETIMDYSIYDAIRSGFGKVVFVIRKDFEPDFRNKILSKYENHIPVELVFQSINDLPEGFDCPVERTKPWGTNHALLMAKNVINEPFAIINADDFYGHCSFKVLAQELSATTNEGNYYMVGYRIGNTLSESGTVARGICQTNNEGYLTSVVERTAIGWNENRKISFIDEVGVEQTIHEHTPVSMNMWGFTPDYFKHSEEYFKRFLIENKENLKAEFYIPLLVNELVDKKKAKVKVLDTTSEWFGITYASDRQDVVDKIAALIIAGEYPQRLF